MSQEIIFHMVPESLSELEMSSNGEFARIGPLFVDLVNSQRSRVGGTLPPLKSGVVGPFEDETSGFFAPIGQATS